MIYIMMSIEQSEGASEYINNAYKGWSVPFNSDRPIYFVIPKARAWNIQPAVCLLHDDAVGNELKVLIYWCDIFQNLEWRVWIHRHKFG